MQNAWAPRGGPEQGGAITTREELIGALAVASELEHALAAQYLFAAYSMKKRPSEGLTEAQVELARGWAGVILAVAREEMGHLATVTNLATAVGGAPHLNRPSFPQPAGTYYPEPFEMTLERFGSRSLGRFVRFEQPPDLPSPDERLAPGVLHFDFLGDLYRQLDQGLVALAGQFGEAALFVGPKEAKDRDNWGHGAVVRGIRDLASARAAIKDVVEEGEGTPGHTERSHWARLRAVQLRLEQESAADPRFDPARDVVPNPATRAFPDAGPGATVLPPGPAMEVAELFNHLYSSVLRMIDQFYSYGGESPAQREGLQACSRRAMSAILRPLAEVLTELPVDDDDRRAGPGFETFTLLELPTSLPARWAVLDDRLERAARVCRALSTEPGLERLAYLAGNVDLLQATVRELAAGEGRPERARPRF